MKYLLAISIIWSTASYAQCKDFFGKLTACPDSKDSMVIYNNAVKVYDFYDNNKSYTKIRTVEIRSDQEKREVFDRLQQAKKLFFVIRKEIAKIKYDNKNSLSEYNPKYKDINFNQYFQEIDEFRFYQRELENQILNLDAPIPIYDIRICPVVINEYKCFDTSSTYFGDIVNIPLYIPLIVKPTELLTAKELSLRNEILQIKSKLIIEQPEVEKIETSIVEPRQIHATKIDQAVSLEVHTIPINSSRSLTIQTTSAILIPKEQTDNNITGSAVFLYNEFGSGSIIGFFKNGRFRKIRPQEYAQFAVLKYAQDLLENNDKLKEWISLHYGEYCIAFN
jgi:hypothetical protein